MGKKVYNMASCMLSILDSLKLYDNDSLELGDETLSEVMLRKMKAYKVDLNKELNTTHIKPVTKRLASDFEFVDKLFQYKYKTTVQGTDDYAVGYALLNVPKNATFNNNRSTLFNKRHVAGKHEIDTDSITDLTINF